MEKHKQQKIMRQAYSELDYFYFALSPKAFKYKYRYIIHTNPGTRIYLYII